MNTPVYYKVNEVLFDSLQRNCKCSTGPVEVQLADCFENNPITDWISRKMAAVDAKEVVRRMEGVAQSLNGLTDAVMVQPSSRKLWGFPTEREEPGVVAATTFELPPILPTSITPATLRLVRGERMFVALLLKIVRETYGGFVLDKALNRFGFEEKARADGEPAPAVPLTQDTAQLLTLFLLYWEQKIGG